MKAAAVAREKLMLDLDEHFVENSIELKIFLLLNENQCANTFPNVHIALRLYLYEMASNCMGKRSFSLLKRINNKLRNTMTQHRASALSLMPSNLTFCFY